jgi:DNA-binding NarL/FixJ family response regulator
LHKILFFETLVLRVDSDGKKVLVVAGEARRLFDKLEGAFTNSTYVLVKSASGDIERTLEECRKSDRSALIVDFDSVLDVDPRVFSRKVEFGRLIQVLVLVESATPTEYESLLRMGCMGFLPIDAPVSQFRRAIDVITSGELWAPRKFVSQICRQLLSAHDPFKLTAREEEILELLGAGHSNKKIAELLFISHDTVRWHMRTIYRKLGVHDRSSVLLYATAKRGHKRRKRN